MRRRGAFLALTAALTAAGCQTTGPHPEVRLPAVLGPLFVNCQPADGAASVQAFDAGQLLGSVEAEWVAKANGDWEIELTNAVGQTVLSASRRGDRLTLLGPLAAKAPRLAVRHDGFLEVNGHLVALRASEVPCLLAFGFPRNWLSLVDAVDAAPKAVTVELSGPERSMELTASELGNAHADSRACTTVSWRRFLFLSSEFAWCVAMGSRREAELSGLAGYTLKWARIDEH